jgi:hypothetical protein
VLGTLQHEAAHGLAYARKVSDTSRQGRYHNRRYATLAGELGLEVAQVDRIGWSATSVPEPTAARYVEVLAELATALVLWRRAEQTRPAGSGRSRNALACACAMTGGSGWPARCWSWPRSSAPPAPNPSSPRTPAWTDYGAGRARASTPAPSSPATREAARIAILAGSTPMSGTEP